MNDFLKDPSVEQSQGWQAPETMTLTPAMREELAGVLQRLDGRIEDRSKLYDVERTNGNAEAAETSLNQLHLWESMRIVGRQLLESGTADRGTFTAEFEQAVTRYDQPSSPENTDAAYDLALLQLKNRLKRAA